CARAPRYSFERVVCLDRLGALSRVGLGIADERPVETYLRSLVRQGVGKDRLGPEHVAADRDRPAYVRRAVPDSTHGGAGRGVADRLSRRRDLTIRAAAGTEHPTGPP